MGVVKGGEVVNMITLREAINKGLVKKKAGGGLHEQ
jgi:hypothetical protein